MSKLYKLIFCSLFTLCFISWNSSSEITISKGQQPQISTDNAGVIRVVFGQTDSIFCSTSLDKGSSFSKPVLVGVVSKMHLGMARGPQLASSAHYSVVTAMDQSGNIHFFMLNHKKGLWQNEGMVNDIKGSAPEGLMNIACDNQDNFYAAWLDLRLNKRNNIFFSSLPAGHTQWLKNKLVYQSPDEHVCECCRPSITVKGSNVAIMFRNWLSGSRDLYLTTSANKGKIFNAATKLGSGTWKLNACPMDGGGLNFNADNTINTTWQRQGVVYYCKAGGNEKELGKGRDCSISTGSGQTIVAMGDAGELKYKNVQTNQETIVSKGSYLKTHILPGNKVLCVWEENGLIKSKKI
ncbi:hypothetical protein [Mucilaginibacter sp. BT774]|uniref:hypothetical protein n=1 Tax=Mucilaginibacter sp. BT774 TaxID=3062276 RepID=UPI002674A7C0|nr:hypothetical protein [Mucilaginibacter sp. BT774]MDO3627744.1 hypothetical protein [Mucilaginibacter sp. BT774]